MKLWNWGKVFVCSFGLTFLFFGNLFFDWCIPTGCISREYFPRYFFLCKKRRKWIFFLLVGGVLQLKTCRGHTGIEIKFLMSKNTQPPTFIQIWRLVHKLFRKNNEINMKLLHPVYHKTKHFRTLYALFYIFLVAEYAAWIWSY